MKIRIVIFDGVDELDFVGPWEIFRRAARLQDGVEVALVTLEPQSEVKAAAGLCVVPDGVLDDGVDVLVVPGGGYASRAQHGVRSQIAGGKLPQRLAELHRRGVILAGVCSGTMILSAAGVLDGRAAVTHHDALPDLRKTAARVIEARVVDDGDVVTCGGDLVARPGVVDGGTALGSGRRCENCGRSRVRAESGCPCGRSLRH